MSSEAEANFRDVERQLDDALRKDRAALAAEGIDTVDESQRSYHYKNQYLSWSLRFESRCSRGSEIEKVWGRLSVFEGSPHIVKVWQRVEIFQIGARPRWENSVEREVSLQSLLREGLGTAVLCEVEASRAAAERAG